MTSSTNALIFIPDISGFTEFVKQTEIDHSRHIIEELLGVIVDSNQMNFQISEIEGDAILFYRFGETPDFSEFMRQVEKMFHSFHQSLKSFESHLICHCGACSSAPQLRLKMVAHYGDLVNLKVKGFNKLHGSDMILAHRLLKNTIEEDQYLLFTSATFQLLPDDYENGMPAIDHIDHFEGFGEIHLKYISLDHLMKTIPDPEIKNDEVGQDKNPIQINKTIQAPMDFTYQMLIDHKNKIKWVPGIEGVIDSSKLPKIGESHQCVFPRFAVNIEVVKRSKEGDGLLLVEKSKALPIIGETISVYSLNGASQDSTELNLQIHLASRNLFVRFIKRLYKTNFKKQFDGSLDAFKRYVEISYAKQISQTIMQNHV